MTKYQKAKNIIARYPNPTTAQARRIRHRVKAAYGEKPALTAKNLFPFVDMVWIDEVR